jgi:predicted amidophosphoribosyltransferase
MPSVTELTAVYTNFLLGPRTGPDVCELCFNFTRGYSRCYACSHVEQHLDAFAPISYSVALEQLHHALRSYKRLTGDAARRLTIELAAVLWRFLEAHEECVAAKAGTAGTRFDLVTAVPSGARARDAEHPLRTIIGGLVKPTRDRYAPLLARSEHPASTREFNAKKFEPTRPIAGESVLLVDDTWTTGASAHSAAAALKDAGASRVAAVVIGRHLNPEWHENDRRIRHISHPFDWSTCALCEKRNQRG